MAKYKIIPSSRTIVHSPISIGHKAEKGVEAIEFDLTAWVETYGSGTLTVIMRRWGDAIPYPIALEIDENNKATWTLSDIDTAKAGMAYAQLSYIVGDEVVKKSDIYTFRVMDSLTGEGDPPEAYESWLEHLTRLAAEAMADVLDIEGIVTDKTLTVDGGIADAKTVGDALALKADKSTTYTKTEVDTLIESVDVETDTTLSVTGKPADAKKTGDEITALKADLGALNGWEVVAIPWNISNRGTINASTGEIGTNNGVYYIIIDLTDVEYTKLYFKTASFGGNFGYGFMLSDNTWTGVHTTTVGFITVDIPSNATEFRLCWNGTGQDIHGLKAVELVNLKETVDALPPEIHNTYDVDITADYETCGTLITNGGVGATVDVGTIVYNPNYVHFRVQTTAGRVFKVKGAGGSTARLWCFTDSDNKILSVSNSNLVTDVTITAVQDGYLIVNTLTTSAVGEYYVKKVVDEFEYARYAEQTLNNKIDGKPMGNAYLFGEACINEFSVTNIPALTVPETGIVSYFNGLYDALVAEYPNYITKVDCATDIGLTVPSELAELPIYLYKFVPNYVPIMPGSGSVADRYGETKLKVMVISGVHPEYTAMYDLYQTMKQVCEKWDEVPAFGALKYEAEFYIIPCMGPWGIENASRVNANGVDIARNMNTPDWRPGVVDTKTYGGAYPECEYESKVLAHYIGELKPNIFIDHHNSYGNGKMWALTDSKLGLDIAVAHIAYMSRKWDAQYDSILPDDTIFGHVSENSEPGSPSEYGYYNGMLSFTYETTDRNYYANKVETGNYEQRTTFVETLATDAFSHFLYLVCRVFGQKIRPSKE